MMVTAAVTLRLAIFITTAELPCALNSRPPNACGMIMLKKPCSRINCQTGAGKSWCLSQISQSSSIRHNSSTGPLINACSRSLSAGEGCLNRRRQRGFPLNNSASHQTVPASSASRSVEESLGMTFLNRLNNRLLMNRRRRGLTANPARLAVVIPNDQRNQAGIS